MNDCLCVLEPFHWICKWDTEINEQVVWKSNMIKQKKIGFRGIIGFLDNCKNYCSRGLHIFGRRHVRLIWVSFSIGQKSLKGSPRMKITVRVYFWLICYFNHDFSFNFLSLLYFWLLAGIIQKEFFLRRSSTVFLSGHCILRPALGNTFDAWVPVRVSFYVSESHCKGQFPRPCFWAAYTRHSEFECLPRDVIRRNYVSQN